MLPSRGNKTQKNFSLGGARSWFEKFCDDHGYDERTVFLGGVLALTEMSHDQRRAYFSRISKWEQSDFRVEPPAASVSAGSDADADGGTGRRRPPRHPPSQI